mgnify:FL=1
MKLKQHISSWWQTLKSKRHILGKRSIIYTCSGVVILALFSAVFGTIRSCRKPIARQLYGEEIGSKGLRYKPGAHIYDPATGKVLLDSISWLYIAGDDSIAVVARDKKRAYVNLNTARLLTPFDYDKAWIFSSDRGVMVKNDSIYIFRRDGSLLNQRGLPYHNQYELLFYKGSLIVEMDNNLYGMMDTAAQWILEPQYTSIERDYQHNFYNTKREEQCIVYSFQLDTILMGNYKSVDIDWSEGIIATEYNGIQHLFDYQGKLVYEVIFKQIEELTYNTHRKDADDHDIYEETSCYVYTDYNGKCGLMNRNYHVLTPPLFNNIEAQTQHIFFASFGDGYSRFGTLIDDHGKPIR